MRSDHARVAPEITGGSEREHVHRIGARLHAAREVGRRRRLRAKLPPMVVGLTGIVVGISGSSMVYDSALRLTFMEVTLVGLAVFVLCVLPTERRTITAVSLVTLAVHVLGASTTLLFGVLRAEFDPHVRVAASDWWSCVPATLVANRAACSTHMIRLASALAQLCAWACGSALLVVSLTRFAHGRPRIDALFLALGCNCVVFAVGHMASFLSVASLGGVAEYPTPPYALVGHAITLCAGVFSLHPAWRASVVGWLASRGEAGSSAIAISSLMGAGSTEDVLVRSRALLRAVSADQLRASDFATNVIPADVEARTRPARAGEIDAFVSHSWQADPNARWNALVEWCDDFKRQHGRWPLLWVDRFCIVTCDVSMCVACLPVFVSSCNTLLVLFDETFLSRLWCIVELWCFLAMGGDPAHVVVRDTRAMCAAEVEPAQRFSRLRMADDCAERDVGPREDAAGWAAAQPTAEAAARAPRVSLWPPSPSSVTCLAAGEHELLPLEQLIDCFNVRSAMCSVHRDRDRLLDLVETYPGGLSRFHVEVQAMLRRCIRAAPVRALIARPFIGTPALTHRALIVGVAAP
ncbi:hypothetical protein KFE25_010978 [Diacronema lutheri]|uniref:Uncharacterized protein n=2 Tax=Diacronema lutheri TaxID=2081491 RepID=A0A8J5X9M5_DIALT|nr:hypothetical protein KFE25_010978 [Diacronema lutheri]